MLQIATRTLITERPPDIRFFRAPGIWTRTWLTWRNLQILKAQISRMIYCMTHGSRGKIAIIASRMSNYLHQPLAFICVYLLNPETEWM